MVRNKWLAIAGVVFAGVAILGCSSTSGRSGGAAGSSTPTTDTAAADSTANSGSSPAATDTVVTNPPASSTPATAAPTSAAGAVPDRPTITSSGPGGGSGELEIVWAAVPTATSYVVYRGPTDTGPWTVVAEFNVITGSTMVAPEVLNLFGDHQTFAPGAYTSDGASTTFTYVESSVISPAYFKVRAYNQVGQGHSSAAACAKLMSATC